MIEQIMRENLLVLAQAYATAKGWSLATVSKQIHGNQAFLAQFLSGQVSTTIRTYEKMVGKIRTDWPKGLGWPETRAVPSPKRVPYRAPVSMPGRDSGGKFLGKKLHKRSRRA